MAQLVKNSPPTWEIWVQSLGWEDPLVKGNSYLLQYSGLENSMDCIVHGVSKSRTQLSGFHWLVPNEQFWNTGHQKLDCNHQLISPAAFPMEQSEKYSYHQKTNSLPLFNDS